MKVLPGMAAPAQQQSTIAPIIQGIGGAVSSFSGINFGGSGGTGQPMLSTGNVDFTAPSLQSSIPFSAGNYSYGNYPSGGYFP